MRLGVYLIGLTPSYVGGLTTYALGLVNGLQRSAGEHQIVLFVDADARSVILSRHKLAERVTITEIREPPRSVIERITRLPLFAHFHEHVRNRQMASVAAQINCACDVVIFPMCFMATYALEVPSIVAFHDLQHAVYPHFFTWRSRRSRQVLFDATFDNATLIQASSIFMKDEVLRLYPKLASSKIAIIPEGVEYTTFASTPAINARSEFQLPEHFLFYPAQFWHHKNHLRLLEAISNLRDSTNTSIPLVCTGANYEAAPQIRKFLDTRGLGGQVYLLGKVPFAALLSLYHQATYVVSASLYESSCLPLLEAAAAGTPLVMSAIPPNVEATSKFSLRLFEPNDVRDIGKVLMSAWQQRFENSAAILQNRRAAQAFDWSAIAVRYLENAASLMSSQRKSQ